MVLRNGAESIIILICLKKYDRSVAQLVERRSPKPEVAGSMPVAPARSFNDTDFSIGPLYKLS